jgi:hypothetical protein
MSTMTDAQIAARIEASDGSHDGHTDPLHERLIGVMHGLGLGDEEAWTAVASLEDADPNTEQRVAAWRALDALSAALGL